MSHVSVSLTVKAYPGSWLFVFVCIHSQLLARLEEGSEIPFDAVDLYEHILVLQLVPPYVQRRIPFEYGMRTVSPGTHILPKFMHT